MYWSKPRGDRFKTRQVLCTLCFVSRARQIGIGDCCRLRPWAVAIVGLPTAAMVRDVTRLAPSNVAVGVQADSILLTHARTSPRQHTENLRREAHGSGEEPLPPAGLDQDSYLLAHAKNLPRMQCEGVRREARALSTKTNGNDGSLTIDASTFTAGSDGPPESPGISVGSHVAAIDSPRNAERSAAQPLPPRAATPTAAGSCRASVLRRLAADPINRPEAIIGLTLFFLLNALLCPL